MSLTRCKFALAWLGGLAACGCQAPLPPVVLDSRGIQPAVRYDDLAYVLAEAVRRDGRVDAVHLRRSAERLDAQLRLLAVTGPTACPRLLPTADDRLAYWYNARAAWAMKLWLLADCPDEMSDQALMLRPFPLDGRRMSLGQIDAILAAEDDFRVVAAAPCVTWQRAAPLRKPFGPQGIRQEVAQRFADLLDDPKRLVIDVDRKQVLVPPVLWQFRQAIIDHHEREYGTQGAALTTALLPCVSGSALRRLRDAVGYDCRPAQSAHAVACRR